MVRKLTAAHSGCALRIQIDSNIIYVIRLSRLRSPCWFWKALHSQVNCLREYARSAARESHIWSETTVNSLEVFRDHMRFLIKYHPASLSIGTLSPTG